MSADERYAAGFRMIHPKEGHIRCLIGAFVACVGANWGCNTQHAWSDILVAAGIMLFNMGRMSQ